LSSSDLAFKVPKPDADDMRHLQYWQTADAKARKAMMNDAAVGKNSALARALVRVSAENPHVVGLPDVSIENLRKHTLTDEDRGAQDEILSLTREVSDSDEHIAEVFAALGVKDHKSAAA
jgi:hypothetical protein